MPLSSLAPILLAAAVAQSTGRLDLEVENVRPGLVAEYRSVADRSAKLARLDAKPAFFLGDSSPHPRLPAGPFEVAWTGVILIQEPGPIAVTATVGGDVSVRIDGVTVLGDGKETLKRETGYYRVAIRFRSRENVPARLQLFWEGPTFAREPIPAWRFGHEPRDETPALRDDETAAAGRRAVERFGCARCHAQAFPGVTDPPPGPALADAGGRLDRDWIMHWLDDPEKMRPDAHMPNLFAADRNGFVERWLIAEHLTRDAKRDATPAGDHRAGRIAFVSIGCAACHFVPDIDRVEQRDLNRSAFAGLAERFAPGELAKFIANPHARYPDGRMPKIAVSPETARNIAAYLLLWSKPVGWPQSTAPSTEEIQAALRRIGANDAPNAALKLLRAKGCANCHPGFEADQRATIAATPIKNSAAGCMSGKAGPRFQFDDSTRKALAAYLAVAKREHHPSPFVERQRQLERAGCVRCHQRDSNRPPPLEEVGSTLGGAFLQELPFQRAPRLTNLLQKYTRSHVLAAVRDGVTGLRGNRYSYRMPAYGPEAETLVRALAEADGELPAANDVPESTVADPTVGTLAGPVLVGSQGYGCVSCHVWNGKQLVPSDPGAVGPDLTRVAGRIRRDWFDRYLEDPQRSHPGTPMPSVFERGKPALLKTVLDGEPAKQKDALWSYFAQGKSAPEPKPAPPVPVAAPAAGESPLIAQIPIRLPDNQLVESLCLLTADDDLLVYDLAAGMPRSLFTGGQILNSVQARLRQFHAAGTLVSAEFRAPIIVANGKAVTPAVQAFLGYDRLANGAELHWRLSFGSAFVEMHESLRVVGRRLLRAFRCDNPDFTLRDLPKPLDLPPRQPAPPWKDKPQPDLFPIDGSLERPGYKAVAYPRPKTVSGEDRVMPVALAAHPHDGRIFVASLKTGELFILHDPDGTGKSARFDNYARGLFADNLALLAEDDGLLVLHRRSLTKITETKGMATHFDRVAALPQSVADGYDYGYGLVRDRRGGLVYSLAQYADAKLPGAGGALRLVPGRPPEEIAYGMRNPLGWCSGPEGEIFFTDNQGDWVPTNKLCHVVAGRYYGYPNRAQMQHTTKPAGRTAVWVPYGWARSINGVAYDASGGKFGPFAGQFFLAELMFGGAIIRANVEKVNGEFQGACFPFWGKGLLGPVSLAFDPRGRLFVGGITEPGWMAQPDRGALFRIDFTGQTPFEMQSLHATPTGFRIVFTKPVDRAVAANPAAYRLEHFRYEISGAYGSPELDRTTVAVEKVGVSADGREVELSLKSLVPGRVYMISAKGVRSATGEPLVQPTGAYTLNQVPQSKTKR